MINLNTNEITETIKMIRDEHLDIIVQTRILTKHVKKSTIKSLDVQKI